MRSSSAFAALALLAICVMPCNRNAVADTAQMSKAAQDAAEANVEPASRADCLARNIAAGPDLETRDAGHKTAQAGAGTACASNVLQEKRWVDYYARVYGVPVALVEAIIEQESGWNPNAVSGKGAVGLMQLMPATAARFGVHDRFQANENIRGGVAYLAWLSRRCNGNVRLVTAAYFAGEHEIVPGAHSLPEVRTYVKQVTQKYRQGRMPVRTNIASRRNSDRHQTRLCAIEHRGQ
jgi:soluble lytic murein transglycosylase-like protein